MNVEVESSRRAVKRIKLEVDKLQTLSPDSASVDDHDRPSSPIKSLRNSQHNTPAMVSSASSTQATSEAHIYQTQTREAQARMEEMRSMIGRRNVEVIVSRSRPPLSSLESSPSFGRPSELSPRVQDVSRTVDELVSTADRHLVQVLDNQDTIQAEVKALAAQLQEVRNDKEIAA